MALVCPQPAPFWRNGAKRYEASVRAGRVLLHVRARARQSIMQSMLMQRNAVTIRGARPADLVTQMLAMEELTWAATGPGERK